MEDINYNNDEEIQFNTEEKETSDHALNLRFTIGYTTDMIGAIHNLTLGDKREIFFPTAHTGVIYNYDTHEQKLLQGHCNKITACIAIHDKEMNKRWIVTADSGKDSMIVVWDADTAIPFRIIFIKKSDYIVSLDVTKNCNFIATLSNEFDDKKNIISQIITVWEWKLQTDFIFNVSFLDKEGEIFNLLRFNPKMDGEEIELLVNGKNKILFWTINPTNPPACRAYFPPPRPKNEKDGKESKEGKEGKQKDAKKGKKAMIKAKAKEKEKQDKVNRDNKEREAEEKEKEYTYNINDEEFNDEDDDDDFDMEEKEKEKKEKEKNQKKATAIKDKDQLFYTQSTFLNDSTMVITATTVGEVIVWDVCEALCEEDEVATDRRKIKTVGLLKYKKDQNSEKDVINFLVNYEKFIVIGSGDGAIKFYDYNFIILRWFENVCWLVTSISFDLGLSKSREDIFGLEGVKNTKELTEEPKFECIPFITSDISGVIKRISDTKSQMINVSDQSIEYLEIYRGFESNIMSIAVHPNKQLIAVGTDGNSIFKKKKEKDIKDSILREKKFEFKPYVTLLYYPDYMKVIMEENEAKEREAQKRKKEKEEENKKNDKDKNKKSEKYEVPKRMDAYKIFCDDCPTVIEFSNDGNYLMVGDNKGFIQIFSPENLSENRGKIDVTDITEDKKPPIQEIIFANDCRHLGISDKQGRIGLFRNDNKDPSIFVPEKSDWMRLAKHQFHDTQIISFCFSISDKNIKLYIICKDKYLYEVDVLQDYDKYEKDFPPVLKRIKIEYDCNMTSLVWYPLTSGKDRNLVITNDEYKMRLVMASELTVKQTCLGPTYGGPIKKLRVVSGSEKDKTLLTFMTDNKIFGLIILPLDGNPNRIMGVIGHPGNMQDIRVSKIGDFILTTGGQDFAINGWKYNATPLVEAVQNGGKGNEPFLSLLEGGREGLMYQEMVNFFYYAQIKSKDENTTKQRTLGESVPTKYVHGLMAAMGYYPSKQELENLYNEVKYSKYSETDKMTDNITFEMFVRLYINHRPYKDIEFEKFRKSFENIRNHLDSKKGIVKRDKFFDLLREHGENMDETELSECLEALIGDKNTKNLSEDLDAQYLYSEVLQFQEIDKDEEEPTTK